MVGDIVGSGRVGADDSDWQHVQMLHPALTFLSLARYVTTGAVLDKQRAALGCQGFVDGAKQILWPGWWLEPLQGFFDFVQITHTHAGGIACFALQWLAVVIEKIQGGADAQRFTDIACHRLLRRAVPLHPVE